MIDIAHLFQAFLVPAVFVSAAALLILSINVRLMGIVSRLRQYVRAKHDAVNNNRVQEAEAYAAQIGSIEERAEMIQRCFLLVLTSLAGTILSCLLLGFGLYWKQAATAALVFFVLAMTCLLVGTFYYIREVTVALSSVHNEALDSRFMDLGAPEIQGGRIAVAERGGPVDQSALPRQVAEESQKSSSLLIHSQIRRLGRAKSLGCILIPQAPTRYFNHRAKRRQ